MRAFLVLGFAQRVAQEFPRICIDFQLALARLRRGSGLF